MESPQEFIAYNKFYMIKKKYFIMIEQDHVQIERHHHLDPKEEPIPLE